MRGFFIVTVAVGASLVVLAAEAGPASGFDAPVKKQIVDLGPSRYSVHGEVHNKLTCYYFRSVMVKQYDEGQKGAEWLAFTPITTSKPDCTTAHGPGEKVIEKDTEKPEWIGYFLGVKGALVFFNADDADVTGGFGFAVFDWNTGRKVFEDYRYDDDSWSRKSRTSPFNKLRVIKWPDASVSVRYLRVIDAGCDLHGDKGCWPQVRKRLGLKRINAPVCSPYHSEPADAIGYPVEVTLLPQASVKVVEGPVRCWSVL
jgi:hypothetical protein